MVDCRVSRLGIIIGILEVHSILHNSACPSGLLSDSRALRCEILGPVGFSMHISKVAQT